MEGGFFPQVHFAPQPLVLKGNSIGDARPSAGRTQSKTVGSGAFLDTFAAGQKYPRGPGARSPRACDKKNPPPPEAARKLISVVIRWKVLANPAFSVYNKIKFFLFM